jgi:hypothetical protein
MKTKLDKLTTGKCNICGDVKTGLSRLGSRAREWACFDCIDKYPSIAEQVRAYDGIRAAQLEKQAAAR